MNTTKEKHKHAIGTRFTVTVGAIAHGGHCVARVEGRVVFVRHALPGETVTVAVTEDRGKSFFLGDAVEIIEASEDRVDSRCPVSGPGGCGGCDFQHVSLAAQRELKATVVREQLSRLGGIEWPVRVEALPDIDGLRWRSRVRYSVDDSGAIGFHPFHSHLVVPIEDCPITMTECVEPVLDQEFTAGAEIGVVCDSRPSVTVTEAPPARSGRRGTAHIVAGDGVAMQQVRGREFRLAAADFWQVHPAAAETFAATVAEFAAAEAGDCAWDLYGGAGLFAAELAEQVGPSGTVAVVESDRSTVASGQSTLDDPVAFVVGDVARVLRTGTLPAPDVVVLDPPRKGAGSAVISAITSAGPSRIVYVACDPAALGRDVALLSERGYRLSELRAFDAFPMTHHVECIALFTH